MRITPARCRWGTAGRCSTGGASGIDPYASAVSDVYQNLFGERSYGGKGIYDVDAFGAALCGRVRESALLSHDLFERVYARAGLASDVEVVEGSPARYDVACIVPAMPCAGHGEKCQACPLPECWAGLASFVGSTRQAMTWRAITSALPEPFVRSSPRRRQTQRLAACLKGSSLRWASICVVRDCFHVRYRVRMT